MTPKFAQYNVIKTKKKSRSTKKIGPARTKRLCKGTVLMTNNLKTKTKLMIRLTIKYLKKLVLN